MLNSLYGRLLAWLVIPLLFMSAANLASTYITTQRTSEKIFDKLLVTLALSISEHALATGGDLLTDELLEFIRTTTNDDLYYKVIGPGAAFVMGYEDIPEPTGGMQVLDGHLQFYDANYLGQSVRVIAVSTLVDRNDFNGWMTTFVAQTLNDRQEYVHSIVLGNIYRVILMIIVASVLLSVGVALGLHPLKKLQLSIHQRNTDDLSEIKLDKTPREINGLLRELNDLLRRLSAHIMLTKRFVENAAHQLRTPVTALLPQTQLALRRAQTPRERQVLEKLNVSAEKIARLTNQLLNLAHAESLSLSEQHFQTIDLAAIAERQARQFGNTHPQCEFVFDLQMAPVEGIEIFLGEAIENVLDNARKYSNGNKPITVRSYCQAGRSVVEVVDSGEGIPEADRDRVTERFVRLSHCSNGSGLGLAIVKEIVDIHHGSLTITDGLDGCGTCVQLSFPTVS